MRQSFLLLLLPILSLACPLSAQEETADINLLSLHEGALPVVVPPTYTSWPAHLMLDGSPASGWACEKGHVTENIFIFELPVEGEIQSFSFDTASTDTAGAAAKDVTISVSSTSAETGFSQVLNATLAEDTDTQLFHLQQPVKARWIRLTIHNNYGNPEWTELFSLRAMGTRPDSLPIDDISGTYTTNYSDFHVRQNGTSLTGCYEYDGGILDGSIHGRVMKITWREQGGPEDYGLAVMVFAEDGNSFNGFWWYKDREGDAPSGTWDGQKKSDEVIGCPHWAGSMGGELEASLAQYNRARVYGILFDFSSDEIKAESEPVLREVADILAKNPGWNLIIEGHTDSIDTEEFNLDLSRRRAASVKSYLVNLGIEAGRLETEGYGESRPVADNATELGRAQNRRVELVRK